MLCLSYPWLVGVDHRIPVFFLPPCTLQLGQGRFRSGVALQPLFLNDRLLFINLEKGRECSPKNPKPMLSGLDGSRLPLLQIAVYSLCFLWLWCQQMKAFPPAWSSSAAVARPLTKLDRAICPSASSKPVVVRPLICSNLPLQPRCQDRSYFRSPNGILSAPADTRD